MVLRAPSSRLAATFSTLPLPSLAAASYAVARTEITRGEPSSLTMAKTLPAYIGRVMVPSALMPEMSAASGALSRAARRGVRSLPIAVAVATTVSMPFAFTRSASAAV